VWYGGKDRTFKARGCGSNHKNEILHERKDERQKKYFLKNLNIIIFNKDSCLKKTVPKNQFVFVS
jgi:hypothetical protein